MDFGSKIDRGLLKFYLMFNSTLAVRHTEYVDVLCNDQSIDSV